MTRSVPAWIFDIDGTLADNGHRLHFIRQNPPDWDRFFDIDTVYRDKPIRHVVRLARSLHKAGETLVFASGRPERLKYITAKWLYYHVIKDLPDCMRLYMRPDGGGDHRDHRDDTVVKKELLSRIVWDGFTPIMAFDDRNRVVDMWRANGIPCAQVVEGNY